jgi:hypothetical protein
MTIGQPRSDEQWEHPKENAMTERSGASGDTNKPLFQNMDEQEQIYAPEQVPGAVTDPNEVDAGGTAANSSAVSATGTADSDTDNNLVAGGDGSARTVPVVAVRPADSAAYPVVVQSEPGDGRDPADTHER